MVLRKMEPFHTKEGERENKNEKEKERKS